MTMITRTEEDEDQPDEPVVVRERTKISHRVRRVHLLDLLLRRAIVGILLVSTRQTFKSRLPACPMV
jgi:hypothetical protein